MVRVSTLAITRLLTRCKPNQSVENETIFWELNRVFLTNTKKGGGSQFDCIFLCMLRD